MTLRWNEKNKDWKSNVSIYGWIDKIVMHQRKPIWKYSSFSSYRKQKSYHNDSFQPVSTMLWNGSVVFLMKAANIWLSTAAILVDIILIRQLNLKVLTEEYLFNKKSELANSDTRWKKMQNLHLDMVRLTGTTGSEGLHQWMGYWVELCPMLG